MSGRRGWEDFHGTWTFEIKGLLNERVLGAKFLATGQARMGRTIEVDVATLADPGYDSAGHFSGNGTSGDGGGGTAVAGAPVWAPPAVQLEAPTEFPDDFEVRVYNTSTGRTLVGAIALVSPGNKDRPDTRRAFAAKVVSYLSRKVGVVIVDIVTDHHFNLHDEVCDLLGLGSPFPFDPDPTVYAVSYRPVRREEGDRIQMWRRPLLVGGELPVMPLGLRNAGVVPVDLGTTYNDACRRSRLNPAEL